MCIIGFKPAGKPMPNEEFMYNAWLYNNDGAGFMYAKNGKLFKAKGFMKWQGFLKALRKQGDLTDVPVAIHFRIKTHGAVIPTLTHPFRIDADTALMHNGVLTGFGSLAKGRKQSDSSVLADILSKLPEGWFGNEAIYTMLDEICGYGNKLCIMHASGKTMLINEKAGTWDNEVWWSNTTYATCPSTSYFHGGRTTSFGASKTEDWPEYVQGKRVYKPANQLGTGNETTRLRKHKDFLDVAYFGYVGWRCHKCAKTITDVDIDKGSCIWCTNPIDYDLLEENNTPCTGVYILGQHLMDTTSTLVRNYVEPVETHGKTYPQWRKAMKQWQDALPGYTVPGTTTYNHATQRLQLLNTALLDADCSKLADTQTELVYTTPETTKETK